MERLNLHDNAGSQPRPHSFLPNQSPLPQQAPPQMQQQQHPMQGPIQQSQAPSGPRGPHHHQQQQHGHHQQLGQGHAPGQGGFGPLPQMPQLPPQMFTTAAQLLDLTDKKLVAILRDGHKYIGVLRSWDQFGNLILQDTVERIFAGQQYVDVTRGLFLIRGENVLMLGEIDLDKDDYVPEPYKKGDPEEVYKLHKDEQEERKRIDKSKGRKMRDLGFVEGEVGADAMI